MKAYRNALLFLTILILSDSARAQNSESETAGNLPTFEERVTNHISQGTDIRFLTMAIENDLFASNSDQYYTNGFRLSYFDAGTDLPEWARRLGELYPGFALNETTSVLFSVGQNLYTPTDIRISTPQPNDRPWAAWLYGSAAMISVTNNHVEELEVSLGMVGPAALGEEVQSLVHKYTNSPDPKGWDHQLKNEPGINLSWGRRWPETFGYRPADDLWFSASPTVEINLGNIYAHAEAGLLFRLSPASERISDLPLRVRPALPGTGYFPKPLRNDFSWSVFGGINGRIVGRNIFLDGNSFQNSASVDKKRFVYDVNAGVDFTYGQTRVSYTVVRRSKEFDGQENTSVFGAISLSRRF